MIGRFKFILIIVFLFFFLIILRLFYWQTLKAQDLSTLGLSQYGQVINIPAQRGEIRTSDGFPIASSKISYLVFAGPKAIKDKNKTINAISSLLPVGKASISASLSLDKFWVPLARNVDSATKERIEELNLDGIGFEKQYTRFYPEASMAAQIIGFVGKDEAGRDKGYFGLEGFYDRLLRGKDGIALQIHDVFGKPILAKASTRTSEIDGNNLILSIQRPVQFLVEKKLKEGIEKYGASSGMVGVINPKTGEIIAISSFPSFDPRQYQDYSSDLYKNPFISNRLEPGSTFKPLVMSSAFEVGVVKPQTKCPICGGPVQIGGYEIHTWNDKYYKDTNMVEIIQHSDNTGMVYVGEKLGLDKLLSFLKSFGIGDLTGIDLQGEVAPELKPKESWYVVDLATASFGQGISVTPIELLSAVSAIANEGRRMEPHVVSYIETQDGDTVKIQPKVLSTPISSKTAKVMTELMVNAVEKGEASWTKLKGYRVAGKTGTASIPIRGHYDPNKTITSFIGFAPADDPKFVMLVILDKPTTSIFGAETAAPIFFDIAKDLLNFYGVAPNGQ
ncbi:MAG: penicillin-binding protein 2 [Patescibacteria group bacterium]